MLQRYFDIFAATEEQLTKKAIGRLRFSAFLGIFFMPFYTVLSFQEFSDAVGMIIIALTGAAFLGFVYAAMSRAANRVWVPDKYLDESEIKIKHQTAYMSYKWILISAFVLSLTTLIDVNFNALKTLSYDLTVTDYLFYTFGSLFICAFCLQAFFLAGLMRPLDADGLDESGVKSGADRWYKYSTSVFVCVFLILPAIFGALAP